RWFGPAAGLIAGLVLALTPVAVLIFRFNNPDALLVLLMTAAAYTLVRAVENGRTRWLVLTGLLLGFAFLAKMLQAFLVVPGFAAAYLWAGPPRLGRRIWQTVLMGAGIVAGAGWWILAAQLTPAADRPYFGGSTSNSILQLAIGYNGLGRLTGDETGTIHPYYMVALAPGIAALVGIGAMALWQARPGSGPLAGRIAAATGVLASAVWAFILLDRTPGWLPWLRWVVLAAGVAAAGLVL